MVGSPPDIVYVLRDTGDNCEELRWSLRSLQNLPHGQVWLVGHRPDWVTGINHLPRPQEGRSKYQIQRGHVAKACRTAGVADRFVLFNDDFFVVAPVEVVPVWHRGVALESHLPMRNPWVKSIRETAMLLQKWGYPDPLSYEIHAPFPVEKTRMAEALARIPQARHGIQMRTVYGNVNDVGGVQVDDRKIKIPNWTDQIPEGATFVSTSDRSWREGAIGRAIRARFPEKGAYEV